MKPISKHKSQFYRAVKTYFEVKHNFDGWFMGKVKEPILNLVCEMAQKEDPKADIAILPGLIIATINGVTREYNSKNWWRGKITKRAMKKTTITQKESPNALQN